jgi:hypothetical protein
MKRLLGFIILQFLSLWCIAQPTAGTSGLLNTPAAGMQDDGTFTAGANYLPDILTPQPDFNYDTYNYYIGMAFLPFLEISLRMTLLKEPEEEKYTNQDRSLALRVRLLKEKKYLPSIVIGANDIYTTSQSGNQYFKSIYIAGSKTFNLKGSLALVSLGCLSDFSNDNINYGLFGGLSFSPAFLKSLSVMAEYDSRYVNAGASILLFRHIYLYGFAADLRQFAGGVAIRLYAKGVNDRRSGTTGN